MLSTPQMKKIKLNLTEMLIAPTLHNDIVLEIDDYKCKECVKPNLTRRPSSRLLSQPV